MTCERSYFLPTSIDMSSNATKADRLRRKPDTFRRLTGITPEDFDQVMEDLRPLYEEAEKERLGRPDRERAIGGGRNFKLALEDRLLMLLMYYRLYVTHEFLGFLFDLDASSSSMIRMSVGTSIPWSRFSRRSSAWSVGASRPRRRKLRSYSSTRPSSQSSAPVPKSLAGSTIQVRAERAYDQASNCRG